MEKRRTRGVLLDYCPPCQAVWLDPGELEALHSGHRRSDRELDRQERAENDREREPGVVVLDLCPRCQLRLVPVAVGSVEVDRCEGCGGLFLDSGELPAILRARRRNPVARLRSWLRRRAAPKSPRIR